MYQHYFVCIKLEAHMKIIHLLLLIIWKSNDLLQDGVSIEDEKGHNRAKLIVECIFFALARRILCNFFMLGPSLIINGSLHIA